MQNTTIIVVICVRGFSLKKDLIHSFIDGLQARGQYYFLKRPLLRPDVLYSPLDAARLVDNTLIDLLGD